MDNHLSDMELYLFNEGTTAYAYEALGVHAFEGILRFAVWAPNAKSVSVVGTFNGWDAEKCKMERVRDSGIWEAFLPNDIYGELYKYSIVTPDGEVILKADPYAVRDELRPGTASVVYTLPKFGWTDQRYVKARNAKSHLSSPMSIYEVHLGSWREGLGYRQLAKELVDYVKDMGYTHIEIMPISEYPLDMSWGYQVIGYYAITARFGTPEDFMYLIDCCHKKNIGVLLDWVPAHFPRDAHGLRRFDGTPIYEHPDPRMGEQPQWGTMLFDYGRTQVQSFLISNAVYFLKEYHIDGLRVDAVSCMLYLDYGKEEGQWLKNSYGGRENLAAMAFFKKLAQSVGRECPGAMLIAEESTAFPRVTVPPEVDGLGFNYKWNMGWMNDTLDYMSLDSFQRKWHHGEITFSLCYAFSENFILPFSHDEVVHGKKSLIGRMPGDYWQQFAQLRLLFGYMFAHPGKKLMFMGCEIGQFDEWKFDKQLDWFLLNYPKHVELKLFVKELNMLYRHTTQLYQCDSTWDGFEWLNIDDSLHSTLAFMRKDRRGRRLICVFNFTPVPNESYYIKIKSPVTIKECFNSDCARYGGTNDWLNDMPIDARDIDCGLDEYSLNIKLPPYGAVYFTVSERSRKRS